MCCVVRNVMYSVLCGFVYCARCGVLRCGFCVCCVGCLLDALWLSHCAVCVALCALRVFCFVLRVVVRGVCGLLWCIVLYCACCVVLRVRGVLCVFRFVCVVACCVCCVCCAYRVLCVVLCCRMLCRVVCVVRVVLC